MAMKQCRECGQEVSTNAKTCPNCGTSHPTTTMSRGARSCLGLVGVGFVLILVVSMCGEFFDTTTPQTTNAANTRSTSGGNAQRYHAPQAINVREGPGTNFDVAYTLSERDLAYLGPRSSDGWAVVYSGPAANDTAGFVKASLLRRGDPPPLPDLEVLSYDHEPERYGGGYIVGRVRNNTSRSYGYVQVQINILDSSGNTVVGSTLDNMNNLGPGEIWRFRAPVLTEGRFRYRIEDVTGY